MKAPGRRPEVHTMARGCHINYTQSSIGEPRGEKRAARREPSTIRYATLYLADETAVPYLLCKSCMVRFG